MLLHMHLTSFFPLYSFPIPKHHYNQRNCVAVLMALLESMSHEHYNVLITLFLNSTNEIADHKLQVGACTG